MRKIVCSALGMTIASLVLGCSSQDVASSEGDTPRQNATATYGALNAALTLPTATSDVAQMEYRIVNADEDCSSDATVAERTVVLEEEALPEHLDAHDASGDAHAFSDAFFVLEPGDYRVCVQPLQADGSDSDECDPVSGEVMVMAETTTEIVLVSQCEGDPNGAADIITELNHPPIIVDLELNPSKFITTCETVTLTVSATDENGDPINYAWSVEETPDGSSGGGLETNGNVAMFTPDVAGDFELKVEASDDHGLSTSLSFPIHVSEDEDCATGDAGTGEGQADAGAGNGGAGGADAGSGDAGSGGDDDDDDYGHGGKDKPWWWPWSQDAR